MFDYIIFYKELNFISCKILFLSLQISQMIEEPSRVISLFIKKKKKIRLVSDPKLWNMTFLQQVACREDLLLSCQIYSFSVLPCSALHTLCSLFMAAVNSQSSGKEPRLQVNSKTQQPCSKPDTVLRCIDSQRWKTALTLSHWG